MDTMNSQIWLCALAFIKTMQPRAYTLGVLRCQNKRLRAIFQHIPSWKILGLSEICNYPDYPHVRKLLRGLVHPLVGLEPTYAPGRANRQLVLLCRSNRAWSHRNSPDLYHYRDHEPYKTTRQHSAPPIYRARDDLDFHEGLDLSREHWLNDDYARSVDLWRLYEDYDQDELEQRSQNWLGEDDDRFNLDEPWFPEPWRALRAIANRQYTGAGMFGQP